MTATQMPTPTVKVTESNEQAYLALSLESSEKVISENSNSSGSAAIVQGCLLKEYKDSFDDDELDNFHELVKTRYNLAPRAINRRIQLWNKVKRGKTSVSKNVADQILTDIKSSHTIDRAMIDKITGQIGDFKNLTDLLREAGILPNKEEKAKKAAAKNGSGNSGTDSNDSSLSFYNLISQLISIGDKFRKDAKGKTLDVKAQAILDWLDKTPKLDEIKETENQITIGNVTFCLAEKGTQFPIKTISPLNVMTIIEPKKEVKQELVAA
jgi:hypothetical protein